MRRFDSSIVDSASGSSCSTSSSTRGSSLSSRQPLSSTRIAPRDGKRAAVVGLASDAAMPSQSNGRVYNDDGDYPTELPTKFELMQRPDKQKPLVRVRLSVHYRVHSRQILCVGGSQIPLGWSFLSIAKVPMTWNSGDIWTCEVGASDIASWPLASPHDRCLATHRSNCKPGNASSTSTLSLRSRYRSRRDLERMRVTHI